MKKAARKIYKIEASNQAVGRIATQAANLLMGKNMPEFEYNIDGGGIVQVDNISKLKFTGKKLAQKIYYHYSGYQGGLKGKNMSDLQKADPTEILIRAVKKMLPINKLRDNRMKRLIIK